MSTEALEVPSKLPTIKAVFTWDISTKTYTTSDSPGEGEVYQPKLDLQIAKNVGNFEDSPTIITLPFGDDFTTFIGVGDALPPINVVVTETSGAIGGLSADETVIYLFKGRVSKVRRNPGGKAGIIAIEALGMKSLLEVPLGLTCSQQCVFTFGGAGCQVNLVPLKQTGICTAIGTDRKVTITGVLPHNDALRDHEFRNGYVERNSLRICIRAWDVNDGETFILRERPPVEWLGQEVLVVPGCNKSIEDCRGWDNEHNFGGYGIGMPDYMPVIEG